MIAFDRENENFCLNTKSTTYVMGINGGKLFQTNQANTYRGYVRMIAQLDITYKAGTEEQIVSNTSWKTADSPILFDMRRCGEKFDALPIIDRYLWGGDGVHSALYYVKKGTEEKLNGKIISSESVSDTAL